MASRKKSIQDIENQYDRIINLRQLLSERDGHRAVREAESNSFDPLTADEYVSAYNKGASRTEGRAEKAFEIGKRYVDNIRKTKSYQNTKNKALAAPILSKEKEDLRNKALDRKYSSNTYMGLNNG